MWLIHWGNKTLYLVNFCMGETFWLASKNIATQYSHVYCKATV